VAQFLGRVAEINDAAIVDSCSRSGGWPPLRGGRALQRCPRRDRRRRYRCRGRQRRVALPGCDHDHGLAIDSSLRLAFVACDDNATLLTVDLSSWQVMEHLHVGQGPDVLAFDPAAQRLYVTAESGWL
jgi:hypothetical protein